MLILKLEQAENNLLQLILKNVCRPDQPRITKETMTPEQKDSLDKLLYAYMDSAKAQKLAEVCGIDNE